MSDLYNVAGVGPGFDEADRSSLPGRHDGPADAYRHILGAAELTRCHGEDRIATNRPPREIGIA